MRTGLLCLLMVMTWTVTADKLRARKSDKTAQGGACSPYQFDCGNECIPVRWICDTVIDCENKRDENQNCPTDCTGQNQFRCANGKCVAIEFRCDGENDCGENSDEQGCGRGAAVVTLD